MVIDLIIYIIIPPPKSSTMSFDNLYPPKKQNMATPLPQPKYSGGCVPCIPGGVDASGCYNTVKNAEYTHHGTKAQWSVQVWNLPEQSSRRQFTSSSVGRLHPTESVFLQVRVLRLTLTSHDGEQSDQSDHGVNLSSDSSPENMSHQHIMMMMMMMMMMMIRQFIRRRNMSMKSLQGRPTPGSRNECRTAPDGRRPLDPAHGLEPLACLQAAMKLHLLFYLIFCPQVQWLKCKLGVQELYAVWGPLSLDRGLATRLGVLNLVMALCEMNAE